jgi:hypothetical protein
LFKSYDGVAVDPIHRDSRHRTRFAGAISDHHLLSLTLDSKFLLPMSSRIWAETCADPCTRLKGKGERQGRVGRK